MDLTNERPIAVETGPEFAERQAAGSPVADAFPAELQPPQRSGLRRIFVGPFGLRAGWSLLIYIVLLVAIFFSIRLIHDRIKRAHSGAAAIVSAPAAQSPAAARPDLSRPTAVGSMMLQESIVFAVVFLLSWLMAAIERRPLSAFGLGGSRSAGRFVIGATWGIIAISALIATLRIFHLLSFDSRLDHGRTILGWGALQLMFFFLVGVLEEYLFRGYLQFTLTRGLFGIGKLISRNHAHSIAFWLAAILTSAIFLLAHAGNSGEDNFGLITVFLAGLVFIIALWRTGSLWWAIGFHMAWDWGQSFLYGVPDSGGTFQGRLFATHALGNPLLSGGTAGPEGSILIIPALMLVVAVLVFTNSSPQPSLERKA